MGVTPIEKDIFLKIILNNPLKRNP